MGMNRRDFLRITGLGTLAGLGGTAAWELVRPGQLEAQKYEPDPKALTAGRWGMVVDMRKCLKRTEKKGVCRDCIVACDKAHNIPDIENPKHEVKWLWKAPYESAFPDQQHEFVAAELHGKPFLVLCNHCENPSCVRVCPTQATFKREDGIVMMDFHRCIGCRYCMAACPYGSRSFNFFDPRKNLDEATIDPNFPTRMKGVVEKCNFCAERLSEGKMPACVDACPDGCLVFGNLDDSKSDVRKLLRSHYTIRRKDALGNAPKVFYII